jgi:hypothetical protein
MNKFRFAAIFLFAPVLAACAIGYQARGSLSDVAGELRGKGYPGNNGGGRFVLNDPGGRLNCDGIANPPTASPNPGSCIGEIGEGVVRCTDGREIPVRWEAISCRSFQGSGEDQRGNRLIFRVDRNR